MNKSKIAKILSGMVAIMFIVIGFAHLMVHFTDLTTDNVQSILDTKIPVMSNEESVWKMWQGYSFMMGICFMIIGLFALIPILRLPKDKFPSLENSIIMMSLLIIVSYSGYAYFTEFQIIGGLFGALLQSGSIVLSFQNKL